MLSGMVEEVLVQVVGDQVKEIAADSLTLSEGFGKTSHKLLHS